ncbi:MAG: hypothetical protein WBF79_13525 [Rhodococcus sp. (in: high G+C Gram-positive bacteria)]
MATADDADAWWHSEPPARRVQIYKFLARPEQLNHPDVAGQLEIPIPRTRKSRLAGGDRK